MKLRVLKAPLAVIQLKPDAEVPQWIWKSGFYSLTRTQDELSIFCEEAVVPAEVTSTPGWRAFHVVGHIDFELTGMISSLAVPLAARQISIFSISTYDTDYMVVRSEMLNDAIEVLMRAGHEFVE